MNDSKRFLTDTEKKEVLFRQDCKCHDCGGEVGDAVPFEVHHVIPHSEGGMSTLENSVACCRACHGVRHSKAWATLRGYVMSCDKRFNWQTKALFKLCGRVINGDDVTVVEAVMAAGKTRFSVQASILIGFLRDVDTKVIFVPSNSIRRSYIEEIKRLEPGAKIRTSFPTEGANSLMPPIDTGWIVCTYQGATGSRSLAGIMQHIEKWKNTGWSFSLVADEIHHTNEKSAWGGVSQYERQAVHTIVQTGTPFRSDESAMSIVPYGTMNIPVVHVSYTIRDGLRDCNIRPVSFRYIDADETTGPIRYAVNVRGAVTWREASTITDIPRDLQAGVVKKLLEPGRGTLWIPQYREAMRTLDSIRLHRETARAQCLIACEPGYEKITGARLIELVCSAWKRECPQRPEMATCDDEAAQEIIATFKNTPELRYIAAINMISEGTNIPWLMVLSLFRCIQSEMLFRQLVGRVMRTTLQGGDTEYGRVILPRTSDHLEFAEAFEDARRGVLGVCNQCGKLKPCDCLPVCGNCGQPRPCECEPPPPPEGERVVEALGTLGGSVGGTAESSTVGEDFVTDAKKVAQYRGGRLDEVRLAVYLKTATDLGVFTRTANRSAAENLPSRESVMGSFRGAVSKHAKWARESYEDSERGVVSMLGLGHHSEIDCLTSDELLRAIVTVNEMTARLVEGSLNSRSGQPGS
jgi:hypothetical protein